MGRRALFLPISGLNGRIVRQLYDACNHKLPGAFSRLKVRCIGTPFRGAPFPLLDQKHISRDPEVQVFRSWARMVEFGMHTLGPAQQDADIVICRRLGLDVLLLAAACEKWDAQGERATRIHHGFVRRHLLGDFGISIPDAYILPKFENGEAEDMLLSTFPDLASLPPGTLHAFLERQKEVVTQYFTNSTGQNEPLILDATQSVSDMFDGIVEFISRQLEARRR